MKYLVTGEKLGVNPPPPPKLAEVVYKNLTGRKLVVISRWRKKSYLFIVQIPPNGFIVIGGKRCTGGVLLIFPGSFSKVNKRAL